MRNIILKYHVVGGYLGYRKKGSKASLKASGSFAALLLAAGYLMGGAYASAGLAIALGKLSSSCQTFKTRDLCLSKRYMTCNFQ